MATIASSPMTWQMQPLLSKTNKNNERSDNRKKARRSQLSANDLDAFFAQYPPFSYRPNSSSTQEFYRMCDFFDWGRRDPDRKEAHDGFKTALVHRFNSLYGTEVDDIESWRGLSRALDITPLPSDLKVAKDLLRGKYVNLVDLVDTGSTGRSVVQFDTLEDLKDYTIRTKKYFPKESAYAGGMLKFLLREILNNYAGGGSRRKRR